MYLRTFGGLSIEADASDGALPSLGPRRLALLALVAGSGPRGITRERILGILWPETEEEHARHTLSQTRYSLRRETSREWIMGTTQLRLDAAIGSDVVEFLDALAADDVARAAALYTGPFLDGFYLAGAPQFEQWVEETRSRLHFAALRALETLARRAVEAGSLEDALRWWRRLCELDPFSATYVAGQIRALGARGDHALALRLAREYESRVRRELDTEPDPVIGALVATLRATTPATLPPAQPVAAAEPTAALAQPAAAVAPVRPRRRRALAAAAVLIVVAVAAVAWRISQSRTEFGDSAPFLAVGFIQSSDTAAFGPVLRDMLATSLARIRGIQVVSNSRLLELLPRAAGAGSTALASAARRAGANEILEGELRSASGGFTLSLRRVALHSGIVRQGYTLRAADLEALTDSVTVTIAGDFRLDATPGDGATVSTRSAVAYALYEQGLRSYYQGDDVAVIPLMMAALERDSTFAMAAFHAWRASRSAQQLEAADRLLPLVRRLAARAPDRERLLIEGMLAYFGAPLTDYLAIARELTDRFPADPDGQIVLGLAQSRAGDWARSIAALERAVALDSAAGALDGPYCRVCRAMYHMADVYAWWDSAAAAERTMRRLAALRGENGEAWAGMVAHLLRQDRREEAEAAIARASRLDPVYRDFRFMLDRDLIRTGRLAELEARLVSELSTVVEPNGWGEMPWLLAFTLRNQGRLREAERLAADGILPGSTVRLNGHEDRVSLAIIALEAGRPRVAARRFLDMVASDRASQEAAGAKARNTTWHMTLAATALAAAGDTTAVRALADSVRRIGVHSSFGRDLRLHHFLHGLLLQHQNRHAEAVESFRRSVFSLTDGYTRINLELARSLVALRRYAEAIAVLQPALRGGVDGGNTYVTHTALHEALAHAFHAAGQRDSAAVHYAAVARAWRAADPQFAGRYRIALARSARFGP